MNQPSRARWRTDRGDVPDEEDQAVPVPRPAEYGGGNETGGGSGDHDADDGMPRAAVGEN